MAKQFIQDDCPICENGKLIPYADGTREFEHKRKVRRMINLHYCICNRCGTRGITEDQSEENLRLIAEFENSLTDYISKRNIRRIRDKYRISQAEAGKIFGCGETYFSKWETGESSPTGSAAVLLKSALKHIDVMTRLADDAGITITIPPQINKTTSGFSELSGRDPEARDSAVNTQPTRIRKQATSDDVVFQPEGFDNSYGESQNPVIEIRPKLVRIK